MTLVTSGLALAGLAAMAIPIIIHLLARQRRKPIEWAAMRFLLEAFRKHRRRLQLEQLVLLAVRCLILGLLGLALARPVLESAGLLEAGGSRSVYLVIDDGMASAVRDGSGRTALERHVKQAVELVSNLGPGDTVGLITAARPARALLMPPSSDHGAVIDLLQALTSKQTPTDLPGAFAFIREAADQAGETHRQTMVYLLSEFRAGSAPLDTPLPSTHADTHQQIKLLASPPASEAVSNVQIVSIEPVRSLILPGANDGSGQVTVRLKRSGEQLAADVTRVRLTGEGIGAPEPKVMHWQPGQSEAEAEFMLALGDWAAISASGGRQIALTASIDDDALNADNHRHQLLDFRSQIRVLLVDRRSFGFERNLDRLTAGQWIRRALEPTEASPLRIVECEPAALDLADIRAADVAIVPRPDLLNDAGWNALREFLRRDNLLIITPPAEVNVHQWTEQIAGTLELPWRVGLEVRAHEQGVALAEQQPGAEILRMISSELPELCRSVQVERSLSIDMAHTQAQPLLLLADGSPLAIAGSPNAQAIDEAFNSQDRRSEDASAREIAGASSARGLVVFLAVAPELTWTDLPVKPLMVPLFQELARQGLSVIRASQRINVGEFAAVTHVPAAGNLVSPGSEGERIALDRAGRTRQPLERAGVYQVLDQSGQSIGSLAVNVDPAAGETKVQSPAEVANWLGSSGPWSIFDPNNLNATLVSATEGSPIAGILLALVLMLVLIETLLARWFSHAYRSQADDFGGGSIAQRKPRAPLVYRRSSEASSTAEGITT